MRLKYLPALDGIRASAFALVFVAHSGLEGAVPGGLGVTVFFFLSGYLITTLLRAEWERTETISLLGFYKRRALRILPPLYLVMAVCWLLDSLHIPGHQATPLGLASILFYFYNYATLLVHSATEVPVGLNVVWSLMIEEHFYLIFPFFFVFTKTRKMSVRRVVAILITVCAAVLVWRCILIFYLHTPLTESFQWTYGATDARFDSILWGCILAIGMNPWCGDRNDFLDKHAGRLASAGAFLMLLTLIWREPQFRETLRYSLQGIALLPVFYYIVSSPRGWLTKILSWQPLRWLGWVSYTMYLTHFVVLALLYSYVHWNPFLLAICGFAISAAIAEAVRRGVEIPLRQLQHKKQLKIAVHG